MTGAGALPLQAFCAKLGVSPPFEAERIRAGRNSEVSLLSNQHGKWILKRYYQNGAGTRDRLGTEFGFATFLQEIGVRGAPRPLGTDPVLGCGLYSYLPGKRPITIAATHISQAAQFVRDINEHREAPHAHRLPKAADACVGWKDHLDLTDARIGQLSAATPTAGLELDAHAFVRDRLVPCWAELKAAILGKVASGTIAATGPTNFGGQILSPSDFGFHNSLEDEGQLSFVDFEYAGWDDPAKLICDFICQPELPVSDSQGSQFRQELIRDLPDAESISQRVEDLLPVHRLKWCCIMLNEFKMEDRRRRLHAGVEAEGLLAQQLAKAKRYFDVHLASTR
jgi:hypothetical protein